MSGKWRAYFDSQGWTGNRRLFLAVMKRGDDGGSRRFAVAPPTLIPLAEGERYDVPTLEETRNDTEDNIGDVTGFLQAHR